MAERSIKFGIKSIESYEISDKKVLEFENIGFHAALTALEKRNPTEIRRLYNADEPNFAPDPKHLERAKERYTRAAMNGHLVAAYAEDKFGAVGYAAVENVPIHDTKTRLIQRVKPMAGFLLRRHLIPKRYQKRIEETLEPRFEARLNELNVLERYRGNGIGRALLAAAYDPIPDDRTAVAEIFPESRSMRAIMASYDFTQDTRRPQGRLVEMGNSSPVQLVRFVSLVGAIKRAARPIVPQDVPYRAPHYQSDHTNVKIVQEAFLDAIEQQDEVAHYHDAGS